MRESADAISEEDGPGDGVAFRLGSCVVNLVSYQAGEETLTEQEASILRVLLEAGGKPVSRMQLYREVWGYRVEPRGRALDFAIRRLRAKVGDDTRAPRHLLTVRGVGFRLDGAEHLKPEEPASGVGSPEAPMPSLQAAPLRKLRPAEAFVGRQAELAELAELLEQGERVITLIGPGGVGKSRLAVELLHRLEKKVVVAELGELEPDSDPLPTLGAAFGLQVDNPSMRDVCRAAVWCGVDILLLDRCEHLETTLLLVLDELLARTKMVVLVTSRHRLDHWMESLFDIPPLSVDEGAELLVRRVRALRRGSRLQPTDPVVRRIVERLDGLPLAIELTAGRLRASSPQQVERRLKENLSSLDGSGRDSLGATIAWSWGLLPAPHRQALSALHLLGSVIHPEHAEAVLSSMGDAVGLLEGLVDRSWLQPSSDEPFRYRLLAPNLEWLRAHAPPPDPRMVDALIEQCEAHTRGLNLTVLGYAAVTRVGELALDQAHPRTGALLSTSVRAANSEPELERSLALVDRYHAAQEAVDGQVELALLWSLLRFGHVARAEQRLKVFLEKGRCSPRQIVECLWMRARIAKNRGQIEAAAAHATEGLHAATELGNAALQACISSLLIEIWTQEGNLTRALDAGRRTLLLCGQLGRMGEGVRRTRELAISATGRLAPLYLMDGDVEMARTAMAGQLDLHRSRGLLVRLFNALINIALLEVMVGELDRAEAHLAEAHALEPLPVGGFSRVQALVVRSKLLTSRELRSQARSVALEAVELASADQTDARVMALMELGWLDLLDRRLSSSASQECLARCREGGLRLMGCQAAGMEAWFAARRQEPAEAVCALALEAEERAGFDGLADEQVVALAGAAVGFAAAGYAEASARALAQAESKAAALSHLTILAGVLPLARQELARLPAGA